MSTKVEIKCSPATDIKLSQKAFGYPGNFKTHETSRAERLSLQNIPQSLGSRKPRIILQRVKKYFVLSWKVCDAHIYLNWFHIHAVRCLNNF
jgi:hypothetical protein